MPFTAKRFAFLFACCLLSLNAWPQANRSNSFSAPSRQGGPGNAASLLGAPAYRQTATWAAAGGYSVGREYVTFINNGSDGWAPQFIVRRQFDASNNPTAAIYLTYATPTDTVTKELQYYDNQNRLVATRYFNQGTGGPKEIIRHYYTYGPEGNPASSLHMIYWPLARRIDTAGYEAYTYEYDSLGRIKTIQRRITGINYSVVSNPGGASDTVRSHTTPQEVQDSLFYASPTSRVYAGHQQQIWSNSQWNTTGRVMFTLLDTLLPYYRECRQQHSYGGAWHDFQVFEGVKLPNGHFLITQKRYNYQVDTLESLVLNEIGLDSNLYTEQSQHYIFPQSPYARFNELNGKIFDRRIVFEHGLVLQDAVLYNDSLGIDASGRVLVRSNYYGFSRTDSSIRSAPHPANKWVFTELGPVGMRPSPAPQTLAIAPGPSTNTALLVNLTAGNWQATLVDMQGRATPLGQPDKSGILSMPNLPTGVYSLHLKDNTGRHLHGRFAWER